MIGCLIAIMFTGVFAAGFSYRFTAPLQKMKMTAFALVNGNYEAQTQRENIDRLRESFVANVSHELRTPVAVLRGYIELLRDGTISDPKEIQENYEQMLSESRHLERLVNDLLDLSRLQDAGFRLTMEEVNLCSVVSDAARAIRRTAENRNISVKVVLPDRDCLIKGDYGRIRQMLVILLDNAVKFSYENGEVEISLKWEEHFVIRVTDHGTGIPKEQIPSLIFLIGSIRRIRRKIKMVPVWGLPKRVKLRKDIKQKFMYKVIRQRRLLKLFSIRVNRNCPVVVEILLLWRIVFSFTNICLGV